MFRVEWSAAAHEDIAALFDCVAEQATPPDALDLCERLLNSTEKLPLYPRLYEAAPEYGEGVRRIGLMGQHVLYEVDDAKRVCTVLAVVGKGSKLGISADPSPGAQRHQHRRRGDHGQVHRQRPASSLRWPILWHMP